MDLTREELRALVRGLGEPAYRGDQIFEWIYRRGATSFEGMSNLPKALRARLLAEATLAGPAVEQAPRSADGTRKLLLRLEDGAQIESVLIPDEHRVTLCVSTQVGCPLACKFCATGVLGFQRNLAPHEIVAQFLIGERLASADRAEGLIPRRPPRAARPAISALGSALEDEDAAEEGYDPLSPAPSEAEAPAPAPAPGPGDLAPRGITNMVLMGMGEPLLNAENVARAIGIITDPRGIGFSRHRITLSTVGILNKLWQFLEETGVCLAVSLHAPSPAVRSDLMPIEKKYGMAELLEAIRARKDELKDRVTFEYVLLHGVNDAPEQARELALAIRGIRAKVNLLPFNPYEGAPYRRPPDERVEAFKQALRAEGVDAFIRRSRGRDIAAACGQLALHAREAERIVPLARPPRSSDASPASRAP
jgi:23S rRNA (adenine2503-C2)-methyltransferase